MHFSFSRFPFAQKSQKTVNANQIIFWVPSVFESVVKLEFCFSLPLPTLLEIPPPVFTAHVPYLPRPLFFQGFRPIFPPQCWSVPLEKNWLTKFVRSRRLDINQVLFACSSNSAASQFSPVQKDTHEDSYLPHTWSITSIYWPQNFSRREIGTRM